MKKILLGVMMILSVQAFAQDNSKYDVVKDKKNGAVVIKGECNFDDLLRQPSFGWLPKGANSYKPDTAKLAYLKKYLKNYEIVVFMGTWCDDTWAILPKLYKILQLTGYPMGNYTMYGVDRAKTTKFVEHKLYKIENVPTIMLYRANVEIGRITETLKKSVESDMSQLIYDDIAKQERQKLQSGQ